MNNRIYTFKFRVNKIENEKIEKLFKVSGMNSYSAFFRKMILHKNPTIVDVQTILRTNYEINRVGNNINQIAKKINTYDFVEKVDIKNIEKYLEQIKKTQEKLFNRIMELTQNGID